MLCRFGVESARPSMCGRWGWRGGYQEALGMIRVAKEEKGRPSQPHSATQWAESAVPQRRKASNSRAVGTCSRAGRTGVAGTGLGAGVRVAVTACRQYSREGHWLQV